MRLKELREERNLTQNEVAMAINTSQSNIGRWEKGLNEPAAYYLIKLANLFEVSTDYLLGLSENDTPAFKNPSTPTLPNDEKELLELYRQLPFESKQRLIARAEVMLEDTQEKTPKHGA